MAFSRECFSMWVRWMLHSKADPSWTSSCWILPARGFNVVLWASNPMLKVCVEVVNYFATLRGPIGHIKGMLHVMTDAAFVPGVQQASMPMKSINISLVNRST